MNCLWWRIARFVSEKQIVKWLSDCLRALSANVSSSGVVSYLMLELQMRLLLILESDLTYVLIRKRLDILVSGIYIGV